MSYKPVAPKVAAVFLFCIAGVLIIPVAFMAFTESSYLYEWNIFSMSSCGLSCPFLVDKVSLSFSCVVCLIAASVMTFSVSYMATDPFLTRFIHLVLLFVLSMNFLIFIPSLPALLLGWDGLGVVSFALVVYYQNMKSLGAGMLTILANRVGDVMILVSIGVLVLQGHWLIFSMWDFYLSGWVCFMVLVSGMTKSAQIPFSSWLPAAMAAPTPVSALVHSSTLVTAGVYLLIRFYPFLASFQSFCVGLLLTASGTLLMAGLAANLETDLKKVIALSTLSQLGVMMLSLGLGFPGLALYHLYTHALFKALLFLCAGAIIHNSSNSQDLRTMGDGCSQLPLTATCMCLANLALCGAPFMSGFYSKDLILEAGLSGPTSWIVFTFLVVGTGATVAYSIRLSMSSLWGSQKEVSYHSKLEQDFFVNYPILFLSAGAIVSGWGFQQIILDFGESYFVPYHLKVGIPFILLLGIMFAFIFWMSDGKKVGLFSRFTVMMWFLVPLSAQGPAKFSMTWSSWLLKSIDMGWMEIFGGQGCYKVASSSFNFVQKIQAKAFNDFVFMMVMGTMVILLL